MTALLALAVALAGQPRPLAEARIFGMCQEARTPQDIERLAALGCDVVVRGIASAWRASPDEARRRLAAKADLLRLSRQRRITFCTMITGSAIYPEVVPPGKLQQWASRDARGNIIKTSGWYQGCLNNPEFRAYTRDIGRAVIDAGADGIHYDEAYSRWFWMRPMPCFCDFCCAELRRFLADHFPADELRKRWGIADVASFDYRRYLADGGWADEPWRSPLHPQWWLMQLHTTQRWERWIVEDNKRYARQRYGRELVTNSNQYMLATLSAALTVESTIYDFVNIGTGLSVPYRRGARVARLPASPAHASLIPTYRMARAATPGKPVVVFLDIQSHPERLATLPPRDEGLFMQWLFAEAHLSGCFFAAHYRFSNYEAPFEPQLQAARFIKAHSDWYRGSRPLAQVAVLFSFPSQIWDMYGRHWAGPSDFPVHGLAYYGVCQALLRANIQWETVFIPDGSLFPGRLRVQQLKPYRVVVAPSVYCASRPELEALAEYVRSGGKLVIAGPFAQYRGAFEKRAGPLPPELARAIRVNENFEAAVDPSRADLDAAVVEALLQRAGLVPQIIVANPRASLQVHLRRPASGRGLLVDIINCDFSWARGFRPAPPTRLLLRPAGGANVSRASLFTFDHPAGRPLVLRQLGQVIALELPEVHCYALVVLD